MYGWQWQVFWAVITWTNGFLRSQHNTVSQGLLGQPYFHGEHDIPMIYGNTKLWDSNERSQSKGNLLAGLNRDRSKLWLALYKMESKYMCDVHTGHWKHETEMAKDNIF